eukprot:TRINITY_DN9444_c0_g1_i1.p1 TRINITY_DN9444_c0_g1~~TRINITY_DN9444_c0_g1_i1.p1  ORF type:complete len:229 (+),score=46.88 TRINITY_DN9444_c0_g1_i1:1-687(+)
MILAKFPFSILGKQHRMHPDISVIIKEIIYPRLMDAPSVFNHPLVKGLQDRLVFIDHRNLETKQNDKGSIQSAESDGLSKVNQFEVDMIVKIVHYLIQQGYNVKQMVVLTPYLGQLMLISKALKKNFTVELDEMDVQDLSTAGMKTEESDTTPKTGVRVATVDNYQGEEADIVIASLVRSNQEKSIGFLQEQERVNVLLSRARHGMIIVGNLNTLTEAKSLKGTQLRR